MSSNIMLYPSLNDEMMGKIRFQKQKYKFFYTDIYDEEYELCEEAVDEF